MCKNSSSLLVYIAVTVLPSNWTFIQFGTANREVYWPATEENPAVFFFKIDDQFVIALGAIDSWPSEDRFISPLDSRSSSVHNGGISGEYLQPLFISIRN